MGDRKHLLHVKSNVAEKTKQYGINDFLVTPKKPVDLLYGEIAVNYGKGVEALTIRNTEDNVVAFVNENDFHEAGEIAADGLATEKLEREEAFNYLNNKIDTSAVSEMVSITYAEIKVLREQSKLKAGQFYRITDYVTTTTQENTQSAGHVFDVIVIATDVDTLNENAKVIKHEGDTYFADSNLDAWEIKYDLDNDTTKYAWADATNGKGVIYYMKDEFNNECPYDFKNIQFKRYKLRNQSGLHFADFPLKDPKYQYPIQQAFTNWYDILGTSMKSDNVSFYYVAGGYVSGADIYTYNNKHGSYDRGSLVFNESSGGSYVGLCSVSKSFDIIAEVEDTNGEWFYTFSNKATATDAAVDASLSKLTNNECYSNSIKEHIKSSLYYLNNNIFIVLGSAGYIYSNNFNKDCYDNTFGYCKGNKFDNDCSGNTFGNDCSRNKFGYDCSGNTFGNYSQSNTFGNYSQYNTFVTSCLRNMFGNNCSSNTFGDSCNGNTFGNDCESNTFRSNCKYNMFGNDCSRNTFESNCSNNMFGNGCGQNTFGDSCSSNTFMNSCSVNRFGNECGSNTFEYECSNNTFGDSCSNNMFGNGCETNTFESNCSNNMFGNECASNTFGGSCNYNTFMNSCGDNTFGNSCGYNTFMNNCNSNTFVSNCIRNTFGNFCNSNKFWNYCGGNTFGNGCQFIHFTKDYMICNIVENGNTYITVSSTQTTSSSVTLRNFTIAQGVNNTTTVKTISHKTFNEMFKTTYQNANSKTVNV